MYRLLLLLPQELSVSLIVLERARTGCTFEYLEPGSAMTVGETTSTVAVSDRLRLRRSRCDSASRRKGV